MKKLKFLLSFEIWSDMMDTIVIKDMKDVMVIMDIRNYAEWFFHYLGRVPVSSFLITRKSLSKKTTA